MMLNPKLGQEVLCWYRQRAMPLHGKRGIVRVVSRGKPRNHGIEVDGVLYVVPCGNLQKVPTEVSTQDSPNRGRGHAGRAQPAK
jgi:hypothetical protein